VFELENVRPSVTKIALKSALIGHTQRQSYPRVFAARMAIRYLKILNFECIVDIRISINFINQDCADDVARVCKRMRIICKVANLLRDKIESSSLVNLLKRLRERFRNCT